MAEKTRKAPATRYRPVKRIEVYVWEKFVGALALDPGLGYYVFAYDKDFGRIGQWTLFAKEAGIQASEMKRIQKQLLLL